MARKPRFKRVRTRGFRLTERDVAIVRLVYRYRLLTTEHIIALVGEGSPQGIKRRLQLLFHAGYLDRPKAQLTEFYRTPGSQKMVYALGKKGASLLEHELGIARQSIDWTAKNRSLRPIFLHHTLLVSSIMVALSTSCRRWGNVRIVPFGEIVATKAPEATRKRSKPMTWYLQLPGKGRFGVTPDKIFGLRFLDRPEGSNMAYFFLEADRGTMPVVRRSLKATSIYKKLVLYHRTYLDRVHTKRFGMKHFRVLTVTESTSSKRIKTMVSATEQLEGLHGMFLFAPLNALTNDMLSAPWVNGRGETVRIGH